MNGSKRRPLIWNWPPSPGPKPGPAEEEMTVEAGDNSSANDGIVETAHETAPEETTAEEKAAEVPEESKTAETVDTTQQAEEERDPSPAQGTGYPPPMAPQYPYGGMILARAYFPIQRYGPLYSPREALEKGTLFPDLYRPYPY